MRPFVLVASSSPWRLDRYQHELTSYGFDVTAVSGAVDCLQELSRRKPGVMILECSLLWGGTEGVLDVKSDDPDWRSVPVVLLSNDGVTPEAYRLARFPICGFFNRFPSGQELVSAIREALRSEDDPGREPPDDVVNPLSDSKNLSQCGGTP